MRIYPELTHEQRYQIYAILKAGHIPSEITRLTKVHKSTISRELRRKRARNPDYHIPVTLKHIRIQKKLLAKGQMFLRIIRRQWSKRLLNSRMLIPSINYARRLVLISSDQV